MAKDKQKDKEQLVEELMDLYEDSHDENGWNQNDAFDVACWFIGDVKQQITQLESDEYPIQDFPEYINKIKEYLTNLSRNYDRNRACTIRLDGVCATEVPKGCVGCG
jgi:hypothetical protein